LFKSKLVVVGAITIFSEIYWLLICWKKIWQLSLY
jgi:hypothetical protein